MKQKSCEFDPRYTRLVTRSALQRDIGRLLWIGFEGTRPDAALRATLACGDAGGVTLFARNLPMNSGGVDLVALRALNDEMHSLGQQGCEKLLVSIDQEGGRVQRIKAPAQHYPPMLGLAPGQGSASIKAIEALGESMGEELVEWGFDIDFAPVLDVHTNPDNPIIGDRAFSRDPEEAATRALAFAAGLARAGILSCGKHFPGHGDTSSDSHLALPRLDHPLPRLEAVELLPFVRAIAAKLPMLMTAHVVFAALDESVPATLSKRVITGLLRDKLSYQGVIISDDLDMHAISKHFGVGEAAVAAIEAGCDVLLLCRSLKHQKEARRALLTRAQEDSAFRRRITESSARVRSLSAA